MIQGSPEWEKWRLGGVGASEIAAIIGVCPYNTINDIWLVKSGRSKGFAGNSFTQHGQEREAAARARYELLSMDDMPPACATHPKFSVCRASLDGFNQDLGRILEIKCPVKIGLLESVKAGVVPEHYRAQTQYQLAVTGADELDFFVFHEATMEHAMVKVFPDVEYQASLINAALNFWAKFVVRDEAPPLTDRDVKVVNDDVAIVELCAKLLLAKAKCANKSEIDEMKAEAVRLAGHPKMKCGNVQVSTVLRQGRFCYHKLTIDWDENEAS